jgi:hypothetical protein
VGSEDERGGRGGGSWRLNETGEDVTSTASDRSQAFTVRRSPDSPVWVTRRAPYAPTPRGVPAKAATGPSQRAAASRDRSRVALMVVLVVAAMPVRLSESVGFIGSVSILDILLLVIAATLLLDLAIRAVDVGYRELFWLLALPLLVTTLSLAWSEDRAATMRALVIYAEALVAYLFVVRELRAAPAQQVVTYMRRYVYLVIIPAVLLLFHVPGFAPEVPYKHSSGGYLTFYTRLSHPVLGGSNNLATVLAFFTPILFYWGHTRRDRRATVAGYVTLIGIFLTLSRGVLLSFVLAGVLLVPLAAGARTTGRRIAAKVVNAVALGAVAIGAFYIVNPATHEFFSGRFSVTNLHARSELVNLAFSKVADKPVLGYGGGVNPELDALTGYRVVTGDASLRAVDPAHAALTPSDLKLDSHNAYLQQALYFGLPLGLLVSLALWATVAVFGARRRATGAALVVVYALLVQLISFLFESSFEGTVLRVLFFFSIGFAVALVRAVEAESRPEASG